jgi:hypothetical protein
VEVGRGVDTAIEAVGIPATFTLCEYIVAPGGAIANIGVHGVESDLRLERLWSQNVDDHHEVGRHRIHADAAEDGSVRQAGSETIDHTPLQADADLGNLRHLRQGSYEQGAEGDPRNSKRATPAQVGVGRFRTSRHVEPSLTV